jgi:methionyl-tRNA synthetase
MRAFGRSVSFGQDGTASLDSLHERYARELANDLGNLVSRTTAMIARYRDGRIEPGERNEELTSVLDSLREKLVERFDAYDLTGALEDVWGVVRWLNRHVESTAPWQLAKDDARAAELDRVLYDLADGVRAVAVALSPYLPETAPQILEALRQPVELGLDEVAAGRTPETEGIAAAPLSRVDLRPPPLDRHARAPRRVRRPADDRRAPPAGVGRIVSIGPESTCRETLAIASSEDGVRRARRHPPGR